MEKIDPARKIKTKDSKNGWSRVDLALIKKAVEFGLSKGLFWR